MRCDDREVNPMAMRIRAHYDGKTIVPEEPVNLPVNESLIVQLTVEKPKRRCAAAKEAAWRRLLAGRVSGVRIPDEALSRENV